MENKPANDGGCGCGCLFLLIIAFLSVSYVAWELVRAVLHRL